MKKLGVAFLVAFISVVCAACGDSRDLDKSSASKDLSQNPSSDLNRDSSEAVQEFGVLSKKSTNCDDSYNEKVCGSDALCSASKCLYKNLTNIDEAFKFYVEQEIQSQVAFSKERNEPENQNTSLLVYKYMLSIALPKENEGKKVTTSIEDYYSKQYGAQNQCDFEFKRTSDSLMIEFNNCADSENNVIIFTQKGEAVEIISKSEAL